MYVEQVLLPDPILSQTFSHFLNLLLSSSTFSTFSAFFYLLYLLYKNHSTTSKNIQTHPKSFKTNENMKTCETSVKRCEKYERPRVDVGGRLLMNCLTLSHTFSHTFSRFLTLSPNFFHLSRTFLYLLLPSLPSLPSSTFSNLLYLLYLLNILYLLQPSST